MEYKPGRANLVADALRHKAKLAATSQPNLALLDRIREGMQQYPQAKCLMEMISHGKTRDSGWIMDKGEQRKPGGLLEPLPTLERPWESVSMDFIIGLPTVEGCGNIMVIVDRLANMGSLSQYQRGLTQGTQPGYSSRMWSSTGRAQNEVHCRHWACWAVECPKTRFRRPSQARRPIERVGATCGRDRPKMRFSVRGGSSRPRRVRGSSGQTCARENEVQLANGKSRRERDRQTRFKSARELLGAKRACTGRQPAQTRFTLAGSPPKRGFTRQKSAARHFLNFGRQGEFQLVQNTINRGPKAHFHA
ncbi:hypothetical protein GH714_022575 [Hevea brasiliensis]|uniref:Reverse transcriptase/retrotransposon-derived protein RNase H-like domain-containing protein n=1 Tax=Hevea brasiliensis TaxID=3981 RepID=A0A6A6LAA3_HEVBR|nr:hypothetical protein GH714_022575 [Hevea brasiliensis]